ncbi:MAG: hypothetical protein ABSA50_07855 [Candidatus Bathyarchaeia archaeon]
MPSHEESFNCGGLVGSINLYNDRMVINSKEWGVSKSYQLPIKRIRSVVVERKSVIPFATLTVIAAATILLARYNALWFLVNLTPQNAQTISSYALLVSVVSAIPTLIRIIFVSVSITWDGNPRSFRVGFVPLRRGKRLAQKFQELS